MTGCSCSLSGDGCCVSPIQVPEKNGLWEDVDTMGDAGDVLGYTEKS